MRADGDDGDTATPAAGRATEKIRTYAVLVRSLAGWPAIATSMGDGGRGGGDGVIFTISCLAAVRRSGGNNLE